MNQRFQALNELGEQFQRASEAAEVDGTRSARRGLRLVGKRVALRPSNRILWPLAGASLTALIAAIIAAIVLLSAGTPAAYAGWQPVPTAASLTAVSNAVRKCYQVGLQNNSLGQPVLTEARGKSTAALFVAGGEVYLCRYDRAWPFVSTDSMGALRVAPGADQISIPYPVRVGDSSGKPPKQLSQELRHRPISSAAFSELADFREGDGYGYWALGRAGRDVSAVTFTFTTHPKVTATVEHRWYFAWWPWQSDPTSVTVKGSRGTITSPMRNTAREGIGSKPSPACQAGSSGCVFVNTPIATSGTRTVKTPGVSPTYAAAELAEAARDCTTWSLNGGGDIVPPDAFRQPVITDVHGVFSAQFGVIDHKVYGCLVERDARHVHAFLREDIGFFGGVRATPGPTQISTPNAERNGAWTGDSGSFLHLTAAQRRARWERDAGGGYGPYALGKTGTDVSSVKFMFANGKTAAAIVRNGWYFAWWPWTAAPTSVRVMTSSGTITSPVHRTNTL